MFFGTKQAVGNEECFVKFLPKAVSGDTASAR